MNNEGRKNMRKITVAMMVLAILLLMSSSAFAKDNSLTLFGSHGPTYLGLEYERRIKSFGAGIEFGFVPIGAESTALRINALGRYYFDLKSDVTPFVSLAPGVLFNLFSSPPPPPEESGIPQMTPPPPPPAGFLAAFYMYGSAGLEYKYENLRAVLEAGGSITVAPVLLKAPSPVSGGFIVKLGVGLVF